MPSDLVEAYREAVRQYDMATQTAEKLAAIVYDSGKKFGYASWQHVRIINTSKSGGYPASTVTFPMDETVDAKQWPSADAMHQALTAWHAARDTMQRAWNAIPEDQRHGLQRPRCS